MIKKQLENLEKIDNPAQQMMFLTLVGIIGLLLPDGIGLLKTVHDPVQLFTLKAIFIVLGYVTLNFMNHLKSLYYIAGIVAIIGTVFHITTLIWISYAIGIITTAAIIAVKTVKVINGDHSLKEAIMGKKEEKV